MSPPQTEDPVSLHELFKFQSMQFSQLMETVKQLLEDRQALLQALTQQATRVDDNSIRQRSAPPFRKFDAATEEWDEYKLQLFQHFAAYNISGPNLKVVSLMSAGYDHVDVKEVKSRGIKIGNTPNVLAPAVADIAMSLALAVARRMPEGRQKIESNQWETGQPQWLLGQDFQEATVGIVGLGGIGQAIARRVKGFDIARILYTGHSPKSEGTALNAEFVSLDELLKQSDFVFLACSLNNETANLINKEALEKMKSNAILVNVSRGGVVDQEALIEALESRKIWGAGLDVTTPEPLPSDHRLLSLSNCVLLPHLGSATLKTRTNMALRAVENIFAALDGKPLPSSV